MAEVWRVAREKFGVETLVSFFTGINFLLQLCRDSPCGCPREYEILKQVQDDRGIFAPNCPLLPVSRIPPLLEPFSFFRFTFHDIPLSCCLFLFSVSRFTLHVSRYSPFMLPFSFFRFTFHVTRFTALPPLHPFLWPF